MQRRLAFVLVSKLYRQMYANTGIATDSARVDALGARGRVGWRALCRRLFIATPMPGAGDADAGLRSSPNAAAMSLYECRRASWS